MQNAHHPDLRSRHLRITEPSPWVRRFAPLITPGDDNEGDNGGAVLDLAAGGGRHGRPWPGVEAQSCQEETKENEQTHP